MKCLPRRSGVAISANKLVMYVLFIFVVVTFVSNTALIHLMDGEGQRRAGDATFPVDHHGHSAIMKPTSMGKNVGKGNISNNTNPKPRVAPTELPPYGSCAILLFGLPRAFRQYVLPSLVENVIQPNLRYGCDYFVHYYHVDREVSNGRSGRGGMIHPDDIQLLSKAVADLYSNGSVIPKGTHTSPRVSIIHDTNETFWEKRQTQLMKYRSTRNSDGTFTYFPYTEPTYVYPDTIDNIVKQWHSIDAVWNLMEQTQQPQKRYQQVAMMRSDVVYITPVDIYAIPKEESTTAGGISDANSNGKPQSLLSSDSIANIAGNPDVIQSTTTSNVVVIPDFAKYPINDRMIVGPYDAVKLWAAERFRRIDHYATHVAAPGTAMHSETFLNDAILSNIRSDLHLSIYEDPWICFLRVRADGAIWIEDCDAHKSGNGGGFPGRVMPYLKPFLNQTSGACRLRLLPDPVRRIEELICDGKRNGGGRTSSQARTATARENMLQKRLAVKQQSV